MKYCVKYLDCYNCFNETIKEFSTYEEAWFWILESFEFPSEDWIYYKK